MNLSVKLPGLHPHCYAPSDIKPEGRYNLRHVKGARPESDITQNGNLHAITARSRQRLSSYRPLSITPPIPHHQTYVAPYSPSHSAYRRSLDSEQYRDFYYGRPEINPLCLSPPYQQYRKKQMEKEDQSKQKWPDVLEKAFLDALLLVPHMGRKKYTVHHRQCGRNMLITDYLWLAYCESLPPMTVPDQSMKRTRKQVSSHIQVLKAFFRHHPFYHVFFTTDQKLDKTSEEVDRNWLKVHPVLQALAEGRLPDERPNYDYFARLLASDLQVTIKPKRCWIFVANGDIVAREDGTGHNLATGAELPDVDYPYIKQNLATHAWAHEERMMMPGTLLHQFTKVLEQVESSSIAEIETHWRDSFPELAARLNSALASNARCDILHLHLTLEMQRAAQFPANSELNGWVEIAVEQAQLLDHRWKVVTRLARPAELARGSEGETLLSERLTEMSLQCAVHSHGGEEHADGECSSALCRKQTVNVPFPADLWARILANCADYPEHPWVLQQQRETSACRGGRAQEIDSSSVKEWKAMLIKKHLTQMELLPKTAMFQEIWSRPPDGVEKSEVGEPCWERRAILLWTFETTHSADHRGELVTQPEGIGRWRFLTTLDPTSQSHQEDAIIGTWADAEGHMSPVSSGSDDLPSQAITASNAIAHKEQQLGVLHGDGWVQPWSDTADDFNLFPSIHTTLPELHAVGFAHDSHIHPELHNNPLGMAMTAQSYLGLATPPTTAAPMFAHDDIMFVDAIPSGTDTTTGGPSSESSFLSADGGANALGSFYRDTADGWAGAAIDGRLAVSQPPESCSYNAQDTAAPQPKSAAAPPSPLGDDGHPGASKEQQQLPRRLSNGLDVQGRGARGWRKRSCADVAGMGQGDAYRGKRARRSTARV